MSDARDAILARLRANRPATAQPARGPVPRHGWSREEMIARFSRAQQAVRGEVVRLPGGDWLGWLQGQLPQRGWHRVLVGTNHGGALPGLAHTPGLELHVYERAIEHWKRELFTDIQVGISRCRAGIAETGSLVLWPDAAEPRLLSLVPPVHIALLKVEQLHETFAALLEEQDWSGGMPSNALLISGPSKTADIEQTLAYGIHGPKQLITLIL